MRALLILLALAAPLHAVWERPHIARVTWSAPGCLYKGQTFIACYDAPGVLRLGSEGPLDHAYRPAANDIFTLVSPGGEVSQSPLRGIVYLPVF